MIPMIWLINMFLINYWFMDGWPGWKLVPSSQAVPQTGMITRDQINWTPRFAWGILAGVGVAVALYFVIISLLPWACQAITVIK